MSRLGKRFKNRFLRRALAMVLTGTMVMSCMASSDLSVSLAAEQSDDKASVEAEFQERTENASEEAAEEGEVSQKEASEVMTEESENKKVAQESETASIEMFEIAQENKESASSETESAGHETEAHETETDTEETETEQSTEEKENEAYSVGSAEFANDHAYAVWSYTGETLLYSDETSAANIQSGRSGVYKNAEGDILYIDSQGTGGTGKFEPSDEKSRIQINANTKIYIPVKANLAKITIYQSQANENTITKDKVIWTDDNTSGYFAISGDDLSSAECTEFKTGDVVGSTIYYKTELTCTLKEGVESSVICVEIKINNFATTIVSGEKVRDDLYDDNTGDDASLVKYNMEGYANSFGVTGGGVMKTDAANYYTVSTAETFLEALKKIKNDKEKAPAVIRITDNLNLGSKEVKDFANYSDVITADQYQALWHPVLIKSGVSDLNLAGFNNLTIFSTNGAAIKHCNTIITNSENIIIRNLVFDELWEWDDGGTVEEEKKTYDRGGYDRNDWDYICIDNNSDGVWIDHCTFYKAYDGVIDVKHAKGEGEDERVTISWCKFEPKSAPKKDEDGNTVYPFFDAQISYLEKHKAETIYYRQLRNSTDASFDITYTKYTTKDKVTTSEEVTETLKGAGYSVADIVTYTCGQKKTHLLGQSDTDTSAKGIRVTLANNSYKNSMDRMPRLRYGIAHEYNCILDSSELYNAHYVNNDGKKFDNHLVSNGALSTQEGYVFLENCYIDGIANALVSGNDQSKPGYIGANDTIYMLTNKETGEKEDKSSELKPKNNNKPAQTALEVSLEDFKKRLPENYGTYTLRTASNLKSEVLPYAGAGVVKMNPIRWTKTTYGDGTTTDNSELMEWDASADNDPARNDNTDYSTGAETTSKNPPADYTGNTGKLEADKLVVEEITTSIKIDDIYTLVGTTDGVVVIKEITKTTINEKPFTKTISLTGSGSATKSAIAITVPNAGKLTVYASRTPVLEDGSNEQQAGTTAQNVTDYTIDGKGTYFLYASENGSDIYYIEFTEKTDEGEDAEYITDTFKLRVDELDAKTLTEDLPVVDKEDNNTYFKIKIASTIESNSITIGSESFKKRIKFSGAGSNEKISIQIKSLGEGTLTVYAVSGSTSTERTLVLLDSEGKQVSGAEAKIKEAAAVTLQVPGKGIYYLASKGSGINVYGIDFFVKFKKDETLPEDPDDSETEPPTFTTPEGGERYGADEGKESSYKKYNMEGYAAAANVTGGGLLKEEGSEGYYHKVRNEKEFLEALNAVRAVKDKPNVIEITTDLNLGYKEVNAKYNLNITGASGGDYSGVIRAYDAENNKPLIHPTLDETGTSYIKLHDFHNLTIFSQNGATIKHAGILFEGSTDNIIIRNLVFDELWEWDDIANDKGEYGSYDRNDWDYMAIQDSAEGIWIDHCTFYKAYDGVIDIKEGKKGYQRVTISWCEFLPGSKDNTFFNAQMKYLEEHIDETTYYKQLRQTEGLSKEDVWWYAYGQKKTHLLGDHDSNVHDKAIQVTLANNYYKNSMDRMPRLRYGKVHEYNCVLDAQNLYTKKTSGNSWLSSHITNQGAISTCGGQMLLENCYIRGIRNPLYSGNGSSPTGYNKAIGSIHYLNGSLVKAGTLEPIKNGSGAGNVLITNEAEFKDALPYNDYITRDATTLYSEVVPFAGAGRVTMSVVQWERTNYADRTGNESSTTPATPSQSEPEGPNDELPKTPWDDPDDPKPPVEPITVNTPTASPANEAEFPSTGGEVTLNCTTDGAAIYYTISETEAGLTDPADTLNKSRVPYVPGTKIPIIKETYIWAVAVKDGKASEPLKCHYTVASDDPNPPITPADPDDPGVDKTDIWITGLEAEYYYTGAKIIPDIKVWDCDIQGGDRLLVPGVDYAAAYKNNLKVSTGSAKAEIIITGKGNYAGKSVTERFSIVPAKGVENPINVKGAKIEKIADQKYNKGEAINPDFKLTLKGKPSVTYTYNNGSYVRADGEPMDINVAVSNNINQGKAAILVTGAQEKGKTTSVRAAFKITPIDLGKVTLDVEAKPAAYAVKGAIPVLTVKYDGKTLVNGRDYVAKYGNNKKAGGKASVTISGKGNYAKNAKPVSYDVNQLDMSELSVSAATVNDKVKAGKIKATVLDKNRNELKPAQYTLEVYKEDGTKYGANEELKAGETVSIAAIAKDNVNLTGSTPKTDFKVGKDISKAKFKLKRTVKKSYTGSEVTLIATDFEPVTLKGVSGNLEMGKDFEIVAYSNNINKGNATAIIRGIGDYSGTKTIKFKITSQTMVKGKTPD